MDYRELLKKYMANVSNVSEALFLDVTGCEGLGGDFLGKMAEENLSPEDYAELKKLSDELVAVGTLTSLN